MFEHFCLFSLVANEKVRRYPIINRNERKTCTSWGNYFFLFQMPSKYAGGAFGKEKKRVGYLSY